eukprot:CAMPEP_0201475068 /NCGR_PEP_ID=MMETSP0151_2-20130828/554_1 /ASSEMBLY_ACC=CAM_ASM_000257 /TAXON_ID=200890 /ORGANISM="Paramoeba atlantica, Strain 621/1 / CCAP 1560/9" /LENGTH=134 /DNA_ID=CAMNT_0047855075 /DNA_START=52 /DNA_END=456 /DNA_ORIENTATION=+
MVKPTVRQTVVKKRNKKFFRAHADRFNRLAKTGWRRPRGIDSNVRRHFKGVPLTPRIGYGSAKATRHVCPDGFRRFVIRNVGELNMLTMQNRKYSCEVAACIGAKKRKQIVQRAKELDIKVTRPKARLREEEKN